MLIKKLKASVIISVVAFFVIFFIFCGFAIDFSLVLTTRAQLQNAVEVSALNSLDRRTDAAIRNRANEIFNCSRVGSLSHARIANIQIKADPNRAVQISATVPVRPYFLSVLGINEIELQAQASARAVYTTPSVDGSFDLANHIQYELDTPFLAREKEIFVRRGGSNASRDFRVFAGLSSGGNNPNNIRWIEITCSRDNNWYGINDSCTGVRNIGAAKFIRLSLDTTSPPNYYWDEFVIDNISVLTSVRLIRNSSF